MLNAKIGSISTTADGRRTIVTRQGETGHALYGPYERVDPGHYIVEFEVLAKGAPAGDDDCVLGNVDVVTNHGATVHAHAYFRYSQVKDGAVPLRLSFVVEKPGAFQYRVLANGALPLEVADFPVVAATPPGSDALVALETRRFPQVEAGKSPPFFSQRIAEFRHLHNNGADIRIEADRAVVTIDGVSFNARNPDDMNFVGEVFHRHTYNFLHGREACVIDVGMNLGFVSLSLARKAYVKEVHAFEPFKATYDRALANIALNPALTSKITTYNFGLADADQEITLLAGEDANSGSNSVRGASEGTPTTIQVRDAAQVLAPIIRGARSRGLDVIVKIDCEGSEFEIFDALAAAGLWPEIMAVMVEWHCVVDGKTQKDLIEILFKAGFSAIDLSPPRGNGFFYAVRTHAGP